MSDQFKMEIIEVIAPGDFKYFLDVPRSIHSFDPNFISFMDPDLEKILTKKNKRVTGNNLKLWIAKDDTGAPLGRIAAFFEEDKITGGIGFFESVDNKQVSSSLFDVAMEFLRHSGMQYVNGPINFGERDKFWGLLVKGFRAPLYQDNYNPPYYQELFESYGFQLKFSQTTYEITPELFKPDKVRKQADKIEESDEYRIEHFKRHSLESYANDFAQIYNASWTEYEHFEPLSKERVISLMESLDHIIREDLIWFTYHNDRPVAFYVSIIDVNQILKHLNGKMNIWGMLKFLWYKKFTKVDRVKGLAFGVVPEFQGKGIYSAMVMRMYELIKNDPYLKSSELSWIGDFNRRMQNLLRGIGAQECKVHYTYELNL